jgi:hypothetical protein
MNDQLPDVFRCTEPIEQQVDDINEKGLEQQGHGPAQKQ